MIMLDINSTLNISKNFLRKQNLHQIVFKDISKFDSQISLIGKFLAETEVEKLTNESAKKFISKTPSVKDLDIKQHRESEKIDKNNDGDNDGGLLRPLFNLPLPFDSKLTS